MGNGGGVQGQLEAMGNYHVAPSPLVYCASSLLVYCGPSLINYHGPSLLVSAVPANLAVSLWSRTLY